MQETARYAVGLDIGTTTIRCVVGVMDPSTPSPSIVGIGEAPNSGMRKGSVVNIVNVAHAIDKALESAERMSGQEINQATININGTHVMSMDSRGVIAVGATGHEITQADLLRVEEAATVMQLPANREILQVTPRSYRLDGQENIKDPLGMGGVRLEVDAHVITALGPHMRNLQKAVEMTHTTVHNMMVSSLAASLAVLTDQQIENGVVLIDLGGTTTNMAVFEEGELQHLAILPLGGVNVTNDLAIGLRTDLDVAEQVKLQAVNLAKGKDKKKEFVIKHQKEELSFKHKEIDEIVEARLDEIFEMVDAELKKIRRSGQLPGGVVLVGGTAKMAGLVEYAKAKLRLPARVAVPQNVSGLVDKVAVPECATAVGLMLEDLQKPTTQVRKGGANLGAATESANQLFKRVSGFWGKFKS
ncbi:MAG TPA: cell division protein FtsA [Candidatus Saccharimonadales bacterium]|nr:cell division protein FtsA [Candidatus Saccharimonadales bacterium]